jgi:hypothetical protein
MLKQIIKCDDCNREIGKSDKDVSWSILCHDCDIVETSNKIQFRFKLIDCFSSFKTLKVLHRHQ